MSIAMAKANTLYVCGSIIFTWQIFRFVCSLVDKYSVSFGTCYIWMPMFLHKGFFLLRLPMIHKHGVVWYTASAKYECEKCMEKPKENESKKKYMPSFHRMRWCLFGWQRHCSRGLPNPVNLLYACHVQSICCLSFLCLLFTHSIAISVSRIQCYQCCKYHCSWCYSAAMHLLCRNSFHFYPAWAIKIPENKKNSSPQICKRAVRISISFRLRFGFAFRPSKHSFSLLIKCVS